MNEKSRNILFIVGNCLLAWLAFAMVYSCLRSGVSFADALLNPTGIALALGALAGSFFSVKRRKGDKR